MKSLIIGDIHGTEYWKRFNPKDYKHIIILGDYFDAYPEDNKTRIDELNNFKDILDFKMEYDDKVILLLGNHDINQYLLNESMGRKAYEYFDDIKKFIENNKELFQVVIKEGKYICSHAGISKTWWNNNKFTKIEDINKEFKKGNYRVFRYCGPSWDIYGDAYSHSCTWIRPETLIKDMQFPYQIVGHTRYKVPEYYKFTNENKEELIVLENEKHDAFIEIEV